MFNHFQFFITDKCCDDKGKLEEYCGEGISVKLDPFHAVQRVMRTVKMGDLPKPQRLQFIRDLRMVLRQEKDVSGGLKRQFPTTSAAKIIENIDRLLEEWKTTKISEDTRNELHKLKGHATCLENIPPKCGTYRNERLHKTLNQIFRNHGHLSLELAIAILTSHFCLRNRRILNNASPLVPANIALLDNLSPHIFNENLDGFGIAVHSENQAPFIFPLYEEDCNIPHKEVFEEVILVLEIEKSMMLNTIRRDKLEVILSEFHLIPKDCPQATELGCHSILTEFSLKIEAGPFKTTNVLLKHAFPKSKCLVQNEYLSQLANESNSLVILLSTSTSLPIQTLWPEKLKNTVPIYIFHDGEFYVACQQDPEEIVDTNILVEPDDAEKDENMEEDADVLLICNCGRGRQLSDACETVRCKCFGKGKGCNSKCRCNNCKNDKGIKKRKIRGQTVCCRCGLGGGKQEKKRCIDNNCKCFEEKKSCTG
jgi:hypothetical protein